MKEPGAAQIILCGNFTQKEIEKIIKAHAEAWKILNQSKFAKEEDEGK